MCAKDTSTSTLFQIQVKKMLCLCDQFVILLMQKLLAVVYSSLGSMGSKPISPTDLI